MKSNRVLQQVGEDAATQFLERRGYRIIARNWRTRNGELDIVARGKDAIVFVEVKTRARASLIEPYEVVGIRKQMQLRRMAAEFLSREHPGGTECRFDVVSVVLDRGSPRLQHLIAAF